MTPGFSSEAPQSMILWGFASPKNWEKFSDSAKQVYASNFNFSMLITMKDKKKSHSYAMKKVKETHRLKDGQWIPK